MPFEQDGPRGWRRLEEGGDVSRHRKARPFVVEPHGLVAERLFREPSALRRRRQGDHRVGMGVIDVIRGDERVEQRLDRRSRLVGPDRRPQEVLDHRGVVHRVARAQRQKLVEAEPGEAGDVDRRQISAGPLDPEHARVAPEMVRDTLLRGGVPSPLVRERTIGAEQVGAIGEPVERVVLTRRFPVPTVVRGRNAVEDADDLAHAETSNDRPATIAAKRARDSSHSGVSSGSWSADSTEARTTSRACREGRDLSRRHRLHEEVAEHGRLVRPREDG